MKVQFGDKSALNENPQVPEANKITDKNINELKHSINDLYNLVMNQIYGIGDLYFSTNKENPETKLGFGKWVEWGKGRVPVGVDTTQLEFDTPEKEGGEKAHTQTIDELAEHNHAIKLAYGENDPIKGIGYANKGSISTADYMNKVGKNKPMNILQPYITCYMWKRIS